MIADPKKVPAKTTKEMMTILQLSFLNSSILLPTDMPAIAKMGVVVPRKLTSLVNRSTVSAVGMKGIHRISPISEAHAKAGNLTLGMRSLIIKESHADSDYYEHTRYGVHDRDTISHSLSD